MQKIAGAAIAGLIAATTMALAPAANAGGPPKYGYGQGYAQGYNKGYNKGSNNNGWGPGFATGAVVGLGLGVIATTPRPAPYYGPAYYYPAPPPRVYYAPPPPPPPVYYNPAWTEAHVEWCIARYRSYNPATNTFIGYDGYQHQCVGPY